MRISDWSSDVCSSDLLPPCGGGLGWGVGANLALLFPRPYRPLSRNRRIFWPMADRLTELLETRPWLLADGATGTNFFAMGLQHGDAPELWNLAQTDQVVRHYRSFIDAGSDLVLTNSFGGTAKIGRASCRERVCQYG